MFVAFLFSFLCLGRGYAITVGLKFGDLTPIYPVIALLDWRRLCKFLRLYNAAGVLGL